MKSFKLILLVQLIAIALANSEFDSSAFDIQPDWSSIRSNIDTSFSCEGKSYGYYADIANECQLYHVCNPQTTADGAKVYSHSSFICPLGTVFDGEQTTCVHANSDYSCAGQISYYSTGQANPVVSTAVSEVVPPPVLPATPVREVVSDSAEVPNEPVNLPINNTPINTPVIAVDNRQTPQVPQQPIRQQEQPIKQQPIKSIQEPVKGQQPTKSVQEPSKLPSKSYQQVRYYGMPLRRRYNNYRYY